MMGVIGTYWGLNGCRVSNCLDLSTFESSGPESYSSGDIIGYVPDDATAKMYADMMGIDLSAYMQEDGTYNFFGAFDCVLVRESAAEADSNGNVTVDCESAFYGTAMEEVLGDGWTYESGKLPVPKAQ